MTRWSQSRRWTQSASSPESCERRKRGLTASNTSPSAPTVKATVSWTRTSGLTISPYRVPFLILVVSLERVREPASHARGRHAALDLPERDDDQLRAVPAADEQQGAIRLVPDVD